MLGEPGSAARKAAGCLLNLCERGHRPELGEFSEVLGGWGEQELIAGATWSAQSEPSEPEDALEVGEQHLDLLAPVPGTFIGRRVGQGSGHFASILVDVPRDLAGWGVRAAPELEGTSIAVSLAGAVDPCPPP